MNHIVSFILLLFCFCASSQSVQRIKKILNQDNLTFKKLSHKPVKKCYLPSHEEFWTFFIENWLVDHHDELKWGQSFANLNLRQLWKLKPRDRLLFVHHPSLDHFSYRVGERYWFILNHKKILEDGLDEKKLKSLHSNLLKPSANNTFSLKKRKSKLINLLGGQCYSKVEIDNELKEISSAFNKLTFKSLRK